MWHKSGRFDFMPIRMKIEFISGIVNENMKLGDRYQPQYFIDNKIQYNHNSLSLLLLILFFQAPEELQRFLRYFLLIHKVADSHDGYGAAFRNTGRELLRCKNDITGR